MKVNERRTVVRGVDWHVPPTVERDRRAWKMESETVLCTYGKQNEAPFNSIGTLV